jgi:hypothetical protein
MRLSGGESRGGAIDLRACYPAIERQERLAAGHGIAFVRHHLCDLAGAHRYDMNQAAVDVDFATRHGDDA